MVTPRALLNRPSPHAAPADPQEGAYTRAEIQKRYRQRKRREQLDPKTVRKQQRRAEREAALAAATIRASQALGVKLYGVLYVDPPWNFLVYSRETGMDRHVANHYPVMSLEDLFALKPPATKDCWLYLWVPVSQLANAMRLIEYWGFEQNPGTAGARMISAPALSCAKTLSFS
jgi:hypothetical protein